MEILLSLTFCALSGILIQECRKLGVCCKCCCGPNAENVQYEADANYVSYRVEEGYATHISQSAAAAATLAAEVRPPREMRESSGSRALLDDEEEEEGVMSWEVERAPKVNDEEEGGGKSYARL